MSEYFSQLPSFQIIIFLLLITFFLIQIYYWLGYKIVASHRHHYRMREGESVPPVSVVVVVHDEIDYLYEGLPKLLAQDHPNFEVVVVNDCGGAEVTDALEAMSQHHANLRFTVIRKDDRFKHSRKIALLVGIKAACHENIVFTHTDCYPSSTKWLSFMARGFMGADVVIGYSALEQEKGMANRIIRASHFSSAIRYLKAATSANAYRADMRNMGYTKKAFFSNRGFTHLRLALGEDDLLIQKIANYNNTAVIINPYSTTISKPVATIAQWRSVQKYYTYPYRYYPASVKLKTALELFSRFAFLGLGFLAVVLNVLALPGVEIIQGGAMSYIPLALVLLLLILREVVMLNAVKHIGNRLGDKSQRVGMFLYDKIAPLSEAWLALIRRIKPPVGLWR